MNIAAWLFRTARRQPDSPALVRGARTVRDYRGFASDVGALAAGLRSRHGVRPGDRVGICMKNSCDYLAVLNAVWWTGAVAVPINAKLHPKEVSWILDDAGCRCLVVAEGAPQAEGAHGIERIDVGGAGFAALLAHEPASEPLSRAARDLAWLFYTSGTTGRPKGVMIDHGNLLAMAMCYFADVDTLSPGDAMLYAAPLSHAAGFYSLPAVRAGAAHIVPDSGGFDPGEILAVAAARGRVTLFAAPTMLRRLVDAARTRGERGDGLKTVIYGGGPMYLADILEAMDVLDAGFVQIYGQGETPMCIAALGAASHADRAHPRYRARLASVGTPQSAVDVRVTGARGEPIAAGEIGEIEVRGPTVMQGYWKRPEATAETIRGGWLRTGDLGAFDDDGFLRLRDRSKDMIVSGGSNIYPREVEEVLLSHPGVREVSVVGRPHPEWGEEAVACVVPRDGARLDTAALDALCLDNIARFKRPRAYVSMDALPKNHYGKVLKTELRRRLGIKPGGGGAP